MANEHSRNERENCDFHAGTPSVDSVRAVPVDYDSALTQLNLLDVPEGVGTQEVDVASKPSDHETVNSESRVDTTESVSVSAAPETFAVLAALAALADKDFSSSLSPASGRAGEQKADGTTELSGQETASIDSH